MDSPLEYVLEQIAAGKIDKQVGVQLVKRLRARDADRPARRKEDAIAVIGMSVRLPMADHYDVFWRHLTEGTSCIRELPAGRKAQADRLTGGAVRYAQAGYLSSIDDFDYPFFRLSPGEANLLDPNQRIFLQTAWAALEDAGYGGKKLAGSRTGVFIGYNAWPTYGTILSRLHPDKMGVALPGNIAPIIASRLNHLLDLQGPSMAIDTTCSSSLVAVHTACQSLLNGECDQALAGGIKLNILPVDKDFRIGIETSGDETRTFDDRADGTLWGEGAAAVLLKPLAQAVRDRDHVYAVIKGSALNHDGSSIGLTAPNALAQEKLLVDAWERAGVKPETISYIEAHGTGTKLGDPIEIDGITRAFRRYTSRKQFCGIGSVKSSIGHLDGASGIVSLVKAALCLTNKKLPPSLYFTRPNRNIRFEDSPLFVNDRLRDWEADGSPRRCGVSSFGFSGTNCHVVLEEAPAAPDSAAETASDAPALMVLSARERQALTDYIRQVRNWLVSRPDIPLADLCFAANAGRDAYEYRFALAAGGRAEMIRIMDGIADGAKPLETGAADYAYGDGANGWREPVPPSHVRALTEEWTRSGRTALHVLRQLAAAFASGSAIQWSSFYEGETRRRTPFPTYPFRAFSCWMDIPESYSDSARPREARPAQSKEAATHATIHAGSREELERLLTGIWKEVFSLEQISVTDDFYELGGHSIVAVHMEAKMNEIGIMADMNVFQQYPTIQLLAAHLSDGYAGSIRPKE